MNKLKCCENGPSSTKTKVFWLEAILVRESVSTSFETSGSPTRAASSPTTSVEPTCSGRAARETFREIRDAEPDPDRPLATAAALRTAEE
jgi:hypothetical protein